MNNNNKNVHHQSGNEFSLYVGDIPPDCSDGSLERLFQSKFKSVKRAQIIRNEDGSSRGFGFIRFEDQTDFQAALSQQMKIGDTLLRIDEAHRFTGGNRGRYNSFNSTVSNNSNHHNHHYNNSNSNLHHQHHRNQSHHHHQHHHNLHHHPHPQSHRHQHNKQQNQPASGINNNKAILSSEHAAGNHPQQQQHHHHQQPQQGANHQTGGRSNAGNNNNNHSNPPHGSATAGPGQHQPHHQLNEQHVYSSQQHQSSPIGHNIYNSNPQKNTNNNDGNNDRNQPSPDTKQGSKQANPSLSGDDLVKRGPNQSQTQPLVTQQPKPLVPTQASQSTLNQAPQHQHTSPSMSSNPLIGGQAVGGANTASSTTTATTTMPITSVNHTVASSAVAVAMHNSQPNLNTTTHQQAIGHDLRGYVQPTMIDSHLIGAGDQPSVVPPTSFYGHMYPYGPPPPFGYMPPPQPNPVMPISAVPPAPPNPATQTGGVGQQQQISLVAGAVNANRFNTAQQHHHHHPHQPQQPATHVPQAGVDASGLGAMPGGVQAPHQGPFYYYYPSPLYFDQTGSATGAPPNHLYHPQTFHPQFFAVPSPYMPHAHSFNQPPQAPPSSQSDATLLSQPQAPNQQQSLPLTRQQPQQAKDR